MIPVVLTLESPCNVTATSARVALGAVTCAEYDNTDQFPSPTPTTQSPEYTLEMPGLE